MTKKPRSTVVLQNTYRLVIYYSNTVDVNYQSVHTPHYCTSYPKTVSLQQLRIFRSTIRSKTYPHPFKTLRFDVIRVKANVLHVDPETTSSLYFLTPTVSTHYYGFSPPQFSRPCTRPKTTASCNQSMAVLPERVVESALHNSASHCTSLSRVTE
jgi:hypothetical protein